MGAGCPGSRGTESVLTIPGVQQVWSGVVLGSNCSWGSGCCGPPERLVTEERVYGKDMPEEEEGLSGPTREADQGGLAWAAVS